MRPTGLATALSFRRRQDLRFLWACCTRVRGRLPDFICLGAQKAGTTTFQHALAAHPGLHVPPAKELQYFTLHAHRSLAWYASCFTGARPGQVAGEVTPYYLYHPEAPARIARAVPAVRLIVLLRDPVERALSGYFHSRRLGCEPLELEEAFAAEPARLAGAERLLSRPGARHPSHQMHSYLSRSRYDEQLARYLRFFPREQMLLLRSEDFFREPEETWHRTLAHLGVPPLPLATGLARWNAGANEAAAVPAAFRGRLRHELAPTYRALRLEWGIGWDG